MTTHTPGPWRIASHGTLSIRVVFGELSVALDYGAFEDERRANARLISAAPDLLAALETWEKFWDTMPKGQMDKLVFDVGLLNDGFLRTRAALAKVRPLILSNFAR